MLRNLATTQLHPPGHVAAEKKFLTNYLPFLDVFEDLIVGRRV